ncbi:unnamed protein product [Vitrella brassicaformis CCMP3155]|uniref:Uncharacterized protein n=2 Tax=Vitrella brassicaformis TaxID=1169539 RepID=A0A0G4FFH9_VITBC|nr:unnamed protein product [Vitrella brassicaformis CCMP3155]|mmetsp:Transcript_47991/g.120137  ORF Transcript_47991/g.120137 Transcript_47991/m.120137 type:complete len:177 (+) Transcript_47991:151-681(+)|eukprot:CEM11967.1 unnamed protein product [Vitrella brassicaformis CCMP3155]
MWTSVAFVAVVLMLTQGKECMAYAPGMSASALQSVIQKPVSAKPVLRGRTATLVSSSSVAKPPAAAASKAETVKKAEYVAIVANKAGVSKKETETVLKALTETIVETVVSGKKINIPNIGTFEPKHRQKRTGRNPRTGEVLDIPPSTVPSLSISTVFKKAVNGEGPLPGKADKAAG